MDANFFDGATVMAAILGGGEVVEVDHIVVWFLLNCLGDGRKLYDWTARLLMSFLMVTKKVKLFLKTVHGTVCRWSWTGLSGHCGTRAGPLRRRETTCESHQEEKTLPKPFQHWRSIRLLQ